MKRLLHLILAFALCSCASNTFTGSRSIGASPTKFAYFEPYSQRMWDNAPNYPYVINKSENGNDYQEFYTGEVLLDTWRFNGRDYFSSMRRRWFPEDTHGCWNGPNPHPSLFYGRYKEVHKFPAQRDPTLLHAADFKVLSKDPLAQ